MHLERRTVLFGAAALTAVALGFGLFARSGPNAEEHRFITVAVERGNIEQVVAATGAVRPRVTVKLGSQVSGQVAELRADFNDEVEAGQIVAVIDPRTFTARVEQATADLKLAEAGLKAAEAAIARAEASLAQAERDYARNKKLAAGGNLSASALDTVATTLAVARADLAAAKAQKVTAQATIEQRRAALAQARIDLERTKIRSPIDGVVIDRVVDVGQTVAASLSAPVLFEIAGDLRSIQIEASVDEADIGNLRPGNPVRFGVDAYPERRFHGTVKQVRLAPVELQNVVTYTVIISAQNPDRNLLPGMTANLEIVTGAADDVLRIPNAALRFRPRMPIAAAEPAAHARPRGGSGMIAGLADALELSTAQKQRLSAAMDEIRSGFRRGMQGGGGPTSAAAGDPAAMRARFQARLERALAGILTPEQMARYRRLAETRARTRPGRVYVRNENGSIELRRLALGISDNRFTEVRRGLSEGEAVVVREESEGAR